MTALPRPFPNVVVYATDYADSALATALAAAAGGTLVLAGKSYGNLANLRPASHTRIVGAGEGKTVLVAPASPTAPVFDLDGLAGVEVAGLSIQPASGTASGSGHGVHARGACTDLLLEDVTIDGFVNAVRLAGNEGTTGTASAVQVVTIGGTASGGTFVLGLWPPAGGDLQSTTGIAPDATAGTVQAALEALAAIGSGNVLVSGASPAWTLTFRAGLANRWLPLLRATSSLTGSNPTISVSETTKGGDAWLHRVTLRRVKALNSPASWGVHADDVDDLILDGCRAEGNHFDGLKLRRFAWNVQVLGGSYSRNGTGYLGATPAGGDGIDCYAGGEHVRIVGATCDENRGNGIQVKNDDGVTAGGQLSGYGSGKFGLSRAIDVVGVHACRNQGGSGLLVTEATGGSAASSVANVSVIGGHFEENQDKGVDFKAGRHLIAIGAKARRNRFYGFNVGQNARYVDLDGCVSIANGHDAGNNGYGAFLDGKHVRVRGGVYLGTDDDAITDATDETAIATKYHTMNILVSADASDVTIDRPMAPEGTNGGGRSIQVASGATDVIVHHSGALIPNTSLIYGSPGSTYRKTDASNAGALVWTKQAGAVDAVGTWVSSLPLVGSKAFDWPSVANGVQATTTVTVTGAALGDYADASMGLDLQGMRLTAYVSAADTVTAVLRNDTGGAVDLASGTLRAQVRKAV